MHMNRTNGDEKKGTTGNPGNPPVAGRNRQSSRVSRRAGHASDLFLGHFPCTTLTERVVDFLERYNDSIYGFG
jgi:hypothetical protein